MLEGARRLTFAQQISRHSTYRDRPLALVVNKHAVGAEARAEKLLASLSAALAVKGLVTFYTPAGHEIDPTIVLSQYERWYAQKDKGYTETPTVQRIADVLDTLAESIDRLMVGAAGRKA